jgi:hypothetical protein
MNQPILLIPLLLVLAGCADPASHPVSDMGYSETGQPALHAIQNQQLHTLMNQMNSVMRERFMTEPELDVERRLYTQRIAKVAQSLSQTLDAVRATSSTLKLDKTEETAFQALTQKLYKQAVELQEQAEHNRIEVIPATLEQINSTCTSCHALFRKL